MSDSDSAAYFSQHGKPVASLGRALDACFAAEGCKSYVKTIYIGYEIEGEMVAALYGHTDHIELALALGEDDPSPLLKDASHLTWRTLPVAIEVRSHDDASEASELARQACARVRSGVHAVHRDNDHFIKARADRRDGNRQGGDPA